MVKYSMFASAISGFYLLPTNQIISRKNKFYSKRHR